MTTETTQTETTQLEKLTADEAAQEILTGLTETGYDLTDRVAISRTLRRLLRGETEEAQKQLAQLLDSL